MTSFIIPAWNEELYLGSTLDALRRAWQEVGGSAEVVVVDDGSTDRTAEIAQRRGARLVRVDYRQIAAVRNAGARVALGDRLFFIDADTLASPVAIRAGLSAMEGGAAGGGCGFSFDRDAPVWARLFWPTIAAAGRQFGFVGGCFLFCSRDAFELAGGFPEDQYAAEEVVFLRRLREHGPVVLPPVSVHTSGRKLRGFSSLRSVAILARLVLLGPGAFQSRSRARLWYGDCNAGLRIPEE